MTKIQFEGKIRKSGRAYIVTVPTAFVRWGTLPAGSRHKFEVVPTAEAEEPQEGTQKALSAFLSRNHTSIAMAA